MNSLIISIIGRKGGQTSDSKHKDLYDRLIKFAEAVYDRGHQPLFETQTVMNLLKGSAFLKKNKSRLKISNFDEIAVNSDICIIMGGDGTILDAAKSLIITKRCDIPLLGINLGKVGFLTDISNETDPHDIITMLESKEYVVEKRTMLKQSGIIRHDVIGDKLALNDVVISRSTGKIIEFSVFINDIFAYTARGDGVIIATPSGSTAYALSGGGPIIHPLSEVIEIVPIMAQSMSTRPLIINDSNKIKIKLLSGAAEIFIDGIMRTDMQIGEIINVEKSKRTINLIHSTSEKLIYNFYDVLSKKLNWHYVPGSPRE